MQVYVCKTLTCGLYVIGNLDATNASACKIPPNSGVCSVPLYSSLSWCKKREKEKNKVIKTDLCVERNQTL